MKLILMINLITSVAVIKNKLVIGEGNNLLCKLKDDLAFFKRITSNSQNGLNVIVTGRKTFYSIPSKNRPLRNRINIVLTNNMELIKLTPKFNKKIEGPYFMDMKTFRKIYENYNLNVFVIGGAEIYNYFLDEKNNMMPKNIYITEIKGYITSSKGNSLLSKEPDYKYINSLSHKYRLIGYSSKFTQEYLTYRILYYKYDPNFVSDEFKYFNLAKDILQNGEIRTDRTGVGTLSVFGRQLKFNISNGNIPLFTVKKMPFKAIVEELLWMMSGSTDSKILNDKGVKIWNGNTSREFLDERGLYHYDEGILGAGYGFQIRHQGAKYSQLYSNTYNIDRTKIGGFDQLAYVEELLEKDPFSRRIMMNYWNPSDFDKTALLPCHYSVQFYVEEKGSIRYLNCLFNMRSSDELARSWNVVFYTLLTQILALRHNMKAKELIFNIGDAHIYKNHIDAVKTYINRNPRPLPKIRLNEELKKKDWLEMSFSDFELIGYFPDEPIKMDMAV